MYTYLVSFVQCSLIVRLGGPYSGLNTPLKILNSETFDDKVLLLDLLFLWQTLNCCIGDRGALIW